MQIAPLPNDETARLKTLCEYQVLDTDPEVGFDDLVRLSTHICSTPVALISLVDADRQWFKSKIGVEIASTPRKIAFCSHAILQLEPLIVPDTHADDRFADNPLVVDAPYIRFYAGVPLIASNNHKIGTLCVVDFVPRELLPSQIEALQMLSRQVVAQLELRKKLKKTEKLARDAQRKEEILRESEDRFRTVANSVPVLIWVDDPDRESVFYNQTWLDFTGRSLEQELGQGWKHSLHPEDRLLWADQYNAAFDARITYTIEYRLRRADGRYRWMLETGVPRFLNDSTFMGFTGSCVDITDRKIREQEHQFLQGLTTAIVRSSDFHSALGVALQKVCEATQWEFGEAWVPNADKAAMECSPAWYSKTERLTDFRKASEAFTFPPGFGIPGRVWCSKTTEWHQNVSSESPATYFRAKLALKAGLKATLGIPLLVNDEVITVLVFYMFEARREDQRLIDLIAASTEIGFFIQRKQSEEEVRKLLAQEKKLNQFKSNFIANVSHELRTPLTAVIGLSSVLMEQHYGSINDKQEQYLSLIHSSGQHLLNLINDLLDLAKIEAGKQELDKEWVDVAELCQRAVEMLETQASTKQQTITLELPIAMKLIEVDRQRIFQILLNFLSNAVKFSAEEGIITVSSRQAFGRELEAVSLPLEKSNQALFHVMPDDRFLVIEVRDTGEGILPEKQHLLFQTFQQIDRSNCQTLAGSGLGLVLAKQWAELHGGRVSFCSTVGVGSTFSVWLPV